MSAATDERDRLRQMIKTMSEHGPKCIRFEFTITQKGSVMIVTHSDGPGVEETAARVFALALKELYRAEPPKNEGPEAGPTYIDDVADDDPEYCGRCFRCLDKPGRGLDNPAVQQMIGCAVCGNKRCPKGTDHRLDCTNSNETGQPGSRYT